MKLGRYMALLAELVEQNPGAVELEVVYSRDDEVNGFQAVAFGPQIGVFDATRPGDFEPAIEKITGEIDFASANAVCIN